MSILTSKPFFSPEYLKHVIEHMNSDHPDSVLNYVHHFGGIADARSARLDHLDQYGMEITLLLANQEIQQIRIDYIEPLNVPEDAHQVLVKMAKQANPSGQQSAALLERARAALKTLEQQCKTAILGTVSPEGIPDASVAPVIREEGSFHVYVSDVSKHTRNMEQTGQASLFLIEDEAQAENLLARKRATFLCAVSLIERDSDDFKRLMLAMQERFGRVMQQLEQMTDFKLLRLTPSSGRLICGFGQAYDIDPANWDHLTHVSTGGHTRAHKK